MDPKSVHYPFTSMMYVRKDSLKAKPSFFYHGSKVCSLSIYFDDVCEEGFAQSEAFLFFIMDPKSVHYSFTSMMYVRKDSLKAKPSFFYHGSKVCSLSIYFDDVCEEGFAQSEAFLFYKGSNVFSISI